MKTIMLVLGALQLTSAFALPLSGGSLETELQAAYKAYHDALASRNTDALKAAMSSVALAKLTNQLSARGIALNEGLAQYIEFSPKLPPNLLTSLQAQEKNSTAVLVLLAPKRAKLDPDGSGHIQAQIISITFIKEGRWKVDGLRLEAIEDPIEQQLLAGNLKALADPRYQPTGTAATAPAAQPASDRQGVVNIEASGCEAVVSVNGVDIGKAKDGTSARRVGLKKGTNTIRIKTTPAEASYDVSITVNAVDEQEKPYEVFSFSAKQPGPVVEKTFVVK